VAAEGRRTGPSRGAPSTLLDLERLAAVGTPSGPSVEEALSLFAKVRSTPDEAHAIDRLLTQHARAPLPEPVIVVVAVALVERGDPSTAARILATARSTPALMVRAELLARAGEAVSAIALLERVLARDIDWPGARERHRRLQAALGIAAPGRRVEPHETLVTSAPGPFRLVREIGRGGAATVYEAEDRDLGRHVALKV
jgi:eukaryotic-like serine/threonine-protein kinase